MAERDVMHARQIAILRPALAEFARVGFTQSSMGGLARAARVSRAGLYLYFANKEELFRAAVQFGLRRRLEAARTALEMETAEMGLVAALAEWLGQYGGGLMGAETDHLTMSARQSAADAVADGERALVELLAASIAASGLAEAYSRANVTPEQLARCLYAMARGARGTCATREEFFEELGVAVRVLFAVRG